MKLRASSLWLVLIMAFSAPLVRGAGPAKEDEIARTVAENFLKAIWKRDADATLKLVDVPYCIGGKQILKAKEDLKEEITDLCEQNPREVRKGEQKIKVLKIGTLSQFAQEKKFKDIEEIFGKRHSLFFVLTKDDRIVFAELVPQEGEKEKRGRFLFIGVRINNGKGHVVGVVSR